MLLAAVPTAAMSVTEDSFDEAVATDSVEVQVDKAGEPPVEKSVRRSREAEDEAFENYMRTSKHHIKQVTDNYYVNLYYYDKYPSYERLVDRSNHLHGWGKFCHIYGAIGSVVGVLALSSGISQKDDYGIVVGSLSLVEGLAVFGIGNRLMRNCQKTRKEIMRINSVGFPTGEIRLKDKSLVPTLNLMSDNATQEKALGLGLTLCF